MFVGEAFRFQLVERRTEGFRRVAESRVVAIDFDLRQHRDDMFARKQVAQFLLDQITDHALGFCAEHVQRVGFQAGIRRRLHGEQANLRRIAVSDNDIMGARDAGDRTDGMGDIPPLHFRIQRLAAPCQRGAAQCDDNPHLCPP